MTDASKVLFILSLLAFSSLRVSGRYAPPLKKSSHVKVSVFFSLQINCYLKAEAGEERKLDGATTGWKGEGCESPRRKEKPAETGLLDNEGRRGGGG